MGLELIMAIVFSLGFYTGHREGEIDECKCKVIERHQESN